MIFKQFKVIAYLIFLFDSDYFANNYKIWKYESFEIYKSMKSWWLAGITRIKLQVLRWLLMLLKNFVQKSFIYLCLTCMLLSKSNITNILHHLKSKNCFGALVMQLLSLVSLLFFYKDEFDIK